MNNIKYPVECDNVTDYENNNKGIVITNYNFFHFLNGWQVSYQLKILTTALFSVAILRKRLTQLQWLALLFLFSGVAVVQLQPQGGSNASSASKHNEPEQSAFIGLLAVGTASVMSGFAGVFFEKLLKHTSPSIFLRNVQLGVIGIVFGLITMFFNNGEQVVQPRLIVTVLDRNNL